MPFLPFVYLISSAVCEANIDFLKDEIRRTSFTEIRRPSLAVTDALHSCRQDLDTLVTTLEETNTYASQDAATYFDGHFCYRSSREVPDPVDSRERRFYEHSYCQFDSRIPGRENSVWQHEILLKEAKGLEKPLMDTFSLLMSTMSVQDSSAAIQLTRLAFIYAPLSFVTGVFGMNIREINDGTPGFYWCLIALGVSVLFTLIAFWGLAAFPIPSTVRSRFAEWQERREFSKQEPKLAKEPSGPQNNASHDPDYTDSNSQSSDPRQSSELPQQPESSKTASTRQKTRITDVDIEAAPETTEKQSGREKAG